MSGPVLDAEHTMIKIVTVIAFIILVIGIYLDGK